MELGPHVGWLPQDLELFDRSIAETLLLQAKWFMKRSLLRPKLLACTK
jgi:ABC-type protease/lipase transport system fused ATPase/permease subunit